VVDGPGRGGAPGPLLAGLAAVALVVLVAVVAGGSSGSGEEAAAPSTTPSSAASTTAADRPTTSARATTTTAEPAPHGPYLPAAAGLRLVTGGSGGRVMAVDLATGELVQVAAGIGVPGQPRASRIVGDHLLVTQLSPVDVVSLTDGRAFALDAGEVPSGTCGVWTGASPDRVWFAPCSEGGAAPRRVLEYSLGEQRVTGAVELPEGYDFIGGFVPGAGFVLQAASAIFVVGPEGVGRVASGDLLSVVDSSILRRDCDEALRCRVTLLDLATGEERELALAEGLADVPIVPGAFVDGGATGGSRAVAYVYDGRADAPGMALLDVAAATLRPMPAVVDLGGGATSAWSRDGEWLVTQFRSGPTHVYHPSTEEIWMFDLPGDRLLGVWG
jgi:hypothetical protein